MQTAPRALQPRRLGQPCKARRVQVVGRASTASKPVWTGDSIPSRLANWAINTPWLYSIMKLLARNQMKRTAEGRGVRWDAHVKQLEATSELQAIKEEIERKDFTYPDYCLKPFHGYDTGNLNWLAAYEVEPATYAVALRAFGKLHPTWSPQKAYERLAGGASDAVKAYCQKHQLSMAGRKIVDVGCSIGMSTRWLASQFPDADITGMDLSPYFLAVAEWEERRRHSGNASSGPRIQYVHDQVETSAILMPGSVDWLMFHYVIHECPQRAIRDFVTTGARAVRPGGLLVFVDNNPQSKAIQGLPPAIATLMKSTEPWSDEYYSFDVEAAMREQGFAEVTTVEIDHRHRAVLGMKV